MKWPYLIPVLAFLIGFTHCKKDPNYHKSPRIFEENLVLLHGQVKGSEQNDKAPLTIQVLRNNDQQTISPKTDGSFRDTLPLKKPSYIQIVHRDQSVYGFIKPGDSLRLTFQSGKLPTSISFSGNRPRPNNYLAGKQQYIDTIGPEQRESRQQWFTQEPQSFSQSLDSLKSRYRGYYQNYFEDHLPSKQFHRLEQANIDYHFYRQKKLYPEYYRRLKTGRYPEVSEQFKQYEQDISFQDGELFGVPAYQRFLRSVVNQKAQKRIKDQEEKAKSVILKNVTEATIPNDTLQARVLGRFLFQLLKTNGPTSIQGVLSYYRELPYSQPMMDRLDKYLNRWKRIAKGKPAPGFAYPNIEGDTVSLASLEGSYVYIDAWATWCGPCIKEIPYLKTLQESYEEDEVRFVSISLDRAANQQKWQSFVKERDLKGIQLFANGKAFNAKFARDYLINSIPRFILISPNGRIVDPNAQRPSGNIQVGLDKLLAPETD